MLGLLARYTDLISLPAPWSHLSDPIVLAIIGAIGILDFVGDKVPVVDHVLHAAGLVIAPTAGAVVALAAAHAVDIDPALAGCIGSWRRSSPTPDAPRPARSRLRLRPAPGTRR